MIRDSILIDINNRNKVILVYTVPAISARQAAIKAKNNK